MDKKFKEECLDKENAVPFKSKVEAKKKFEEYNSNADYFLKSAQNLLESDTPNTAVTFGFFAMEHKVNALIALYGYDIKMHECTPIFLSRILNRKDLAKRISDASKLRIDYNYRLDLKSKDREEVNDFINLDVILFIKEVDKLIKEYKWSFFSQF